MPRFPDHAPTGSVLLTCAGRRNYLVQYFRSALGGRGRILAADSAPDAPAMAEADESFVVPPITAPGYVEHLVELCRAQDVRLVCSLNDLELPLLATNRDRFAAAGAVVAVSAPAVIDRCADKWETYRTLTGWGIDTPWTGVTLQDALDALERGTISFPVALKPRWGTASIGIEFPESVQELRLAHELLRLRIERSIIGPMSSADPERTVLVQERLLGDEYGVDVVNDLSGRHVATFVKRKLGMRAGETDRAVTVADDRLSELGAEIGGRLGHVGNLDCDVFVGNGRTAVLELNPRFGGGYPFSHEAGADIPSALLAWAAGRSADPSWLSVRPGVMTSKCDRLVPGSRMPVGGV